MPKSLRRLAFVFRLTSFLLVTSHLRCRTRPESACSITNVHVYDLRFTIPTIPFDQTHEYCVPELSHFTALLMPRRGMLERAYKQQLLRNRSGPEALVPVPLVE